MKTKKLKRIIEESIKKSIDYHPIGKVKADAEIDLCEYDPEVSEKFKNMIINIIDYTENLNINITNNNINISCNSVKSIKSNKAHIATDEDYLEISIKKGFGFFLSNGYGRLRSNYKDEKIYDELLPIISNKLKEINSENFNKVFTKIMKDSGLIRDSNLNDLLN